MPCTSPPEFATSMGQAPPAIDAAALAREHGRGVFHAAYRVLGNAAQAEDIQQEVFLRVLESRCDGVESWAAYLGAMATRMAIDTLRRQQRWWSLLPMWKAQAPIAAASAEEAGIDGERARQLRAEVARLSRREAQCFGLRYLQGLEIPEIAKVLRITENNVSVTLNRTRRRLAERLAEPDDAQGQEQAR